MGPAKPPREAPDEPAPEGSTYTWGQLEGPIPVAAHGVVVELPLVRQKTDRPIEFAASRVFLSLERLAGSGPGAYDVFLLPSGDEEAVFAGRVSLYGARRRYDLVSNDPGFNFILEISTIVAELLARGAWDADRLRIRIVPVHPWLAPGHVGRVSVSVR